MMPETINSLVEDCERTIIQAAKNCRKRVDIIPIRNDVNYWERVLSSKDSKQVWKAINWKGKYDPDPPNTTPTDEAFKCHFESLLNTR